jgi:tRNASer (uridine44-2'-O)-methyltransferase
MDFKQIASENTNSSASQFWKAIAIWMKNPHVINRRILASQELLIMNVNCNILDIFAHIKKLQIHSNDFECDSYFNIKYLLNMLDIMEYYQSHECINPIEISNEDKAYLYIRKLLPRNTQIFSPTLEFIFVDKKAINVICFYKSIIQDKQSLGPNIAYNIQHHEYNSTCISIHKSDDEDCSKNQIWLKSKFFPCLIKWMHSKNENCDPKINSLSLISVEKYTLLYNRLKEKYGTEMVKIWPENTDPAKFVYEDIAIATYLLLLWEKERLEKDTHKLQSFVDLGCGNGLLVYILSCEGHKGMGIDLRKRKIWDLFPENTHLQVCKKLLYYHMFK